MRVLFVTSFAGDMFEATGVHLVASFLETRTDGRLLLCHEQDTQERIPQHPRLLKYNLDESDFLHSWLAANRDIIPPALGGAARKCACPQPAPGRLGHKPGCAWGWYNRNASRWFRKIASLDYAQTIFGYDALVWLDSDCYFRKRLPSARIDAWFGEAAVFFHKSPDREVVESGVIGFRMNSSGRRFLRLTADRYRSGRFRSISIPRYRASTWRPAPPRLSFCPTARRGPTSSTTRASTRS